MTTPFAVSVLLSRLHDYAKAANPAYGLPIYGELNKRHQQALTMIVEIWEAEQRPEAQR